MRGGRGYATLACASLLVLGVAARRAGRLPAGQRRQRAGHRVLPAVGLCDGLHLPLPGRAGESEERLRVRQSIGRRRRWRGNERDSSALAQRWRVSPAGWTVATAESARAGSSPARSPMSPAARPGSTAALSPTRTRPRSRCSGSAPRRSRARRRQRGDGARDGRRSARAQPAPTSRSRSPASPGRRRARRTSRWGLVCFAWARRGGASRRATRHFAGDRAAVRAAAVAAALEGLIEPASKSEAGRQAVTSTARPIAVTGCIRHRTQPFGGLRRTIVLWHDSGVDFTCRAPCANTSEQPPQCHSTNRWTTTRARPSPQRCTQIEKQFGKGSIMKMGESQVQNDLQVVSTGSLGLDIALGVGGLPRGRVVEIYGPESSGKTTLSLQVVAAGAESGRHGGVHRRRERARPGLRRQAGRQRRRPADLAAGHRRAGTRDRRHAGALGRRGHHRHRLGRGARAQGRDRGRDGRPAARPAGAADEPGAAQAHRQHQAREHARHLHQPDPDEDRRDVRQPGDHHRRQRAQVLRLGAPRHPPHRRDQEGRRSRSATRRASRSSRTRSRRRSARRCSTSSTARASRATARSSSWASRTTSSRSPARGTPTTARRSARARTTRASSCASIRAMADEIEAKIRAAVGVPVPGALRARGEPKPATSSAGQAAA